MFQTLLMLHIAGAVVSAVAVLFGLIGAIIRKGSPLKLKSAFTGLSIYQVATGIVLVLLKPAVSTLTVFCVGGLSLIAVFWLVYLFADRRIFESSIEMY